eukprot:CAMPEP_0172317540 /NCGR_PEP_ID=MMETSP1058-20130122/31945_1 /TAXON_ID=83371 /ORGANISM="Detonula confervacea, Strain CCMP 353" /LENGTH=187 /DNA_ID=CAMNT_0013032125 /DNA_START=374 /DNA_END=937 /DNA_ORIENTATION=+
MAKSSKRSSSSSSSRRVVVHTTRIVEPVVRTPVVAPVVVVENRIPLDPIVRYVPDRRTIYDTRRTGLTCGDVTIVPEHMGYPLNCADETKDAILDAFDVDVMIDDQCDDDHLLCIAILHGADCELIIHDALHSLDDLLPEGCELDDFTRTAGFRRRGGTLPITWYRGNWMRQHGGWGRRRWDHGWKK